MTTFDPSGLKLAALTHALVPQGLAEGLPAGRVPDPRRLVPAGGDDLRPVGAETRGVDLALVPQGLAEGLPAGRVPDLSVAAS